MHTHRRASLLGMMAIASLVLAACGNQSSTGTFSSDSSSTQSSPAMQESSSSSSAAAMMESSASSEGMMAASSAMMENSSSSAGAMQQSSSGLNNASAAKAVESFYLSWMHHTGNAFTDGFAANNPYLSASFKSNISMNGTMDPVYCAPGRPSTFSLVAIGASAQSRNVIVTETFRDGTKTQVTVGTVKEADGWKVNSLTCGASAASASSDGHLPM